MSLCLEYQPVYSCRDKIVISVKMQIVAGLCLLIALVGKVWIQLESTDVGYQLARERQAKVQVDMERRELELQRSVLLKADNLARTAEKRLGLKSLDPKQARRILVR